MHDKRKAQLKVIENDSKQRKLNFSVRPNASALSNVSCKNCNKYNINY